MLNYIISKLNIDQSIHKLHNEAYIFNLHYIQMYTNALNVYIIYDIYSMEMNVLTIIYTTTYTVMTFLIFTYLIFNYFKLF